MVGGEFHAVCRLAAGRAAGLAGGGGQQPTGQTSRLGAMEQRAMCVSWSLQRLSDFCCPLESAWEIVGGVFNVDDAAGSVGAGVS